jgi:aminopeptidase
MSDTRVYDHARLLVGYCCEVKKGDLVAVRASEHALPLLEAIAAEVAKAGGYLQVQYSHESISRAYLVNASDDTLKAQPRSIEEIMKNIDCFISILSSVNEAELSDVPTSKLRLQEKASEPLQNIILSRRWNVTLHPTYALAQEARKSFEAYTDFVYSAMLRDWQKLTQEMDVLTNRFSRSKRVRITGYKTDVSFSVDGRVPIADDGKKNLPGGEIFTSPLETTVNGRVFFDIPINYGGREMRDVSLTYRSGEIVEATAAAGEELLKELLKTDDGARRLGELGIGMNRGISEYSKNVLFDEKMGDTIHMAIGMAYAECGGTNKSGIHVDMIKSMKPDGAIYFDDEPIYKDGRFFWEG